MILCILSFEADKVGEEFESFQKLCRQRYPLFLSHPFQALEGQIWYTVLKPFNAVVCPYLMMDVMLALRAGKPRMVFVHDMLEYGADGKVKIDVAGPGFETAMRMVDSLPSGQSSMVFRGFGQRIDIAMNALSVLYLEMLGTLTKVETGVLREVRNLQFEQYADPTISRTYGLQKVAAEHLGKSPVAIHKSLRSCKFELMADTAKAMRAIIA
jgi:hypothetical protein